MLHNCRKTYEGELPEQCCCAPEHGRLAVELVYSHFTRGQDEGGTENILDSDMFTGEA
jgi:hypothetical protein